VRDGSHSRRISQIIEIWRGRYKDEVVALRVFKVSRQDPHVLAFVSVSMPRDPLGDGVACCWPDRRRSGFAGKWY